jgi:dihydrodipicolinate synthase/N-acetylneuraminate lyase
MKNVIFEGETYVRVSVATQITGYTMQNIYRLVNEGKIKRVKKRQNSQQHVYRLRDVERYSLNDGITEA